MALYCCKAIGDMCNGIGNACSSSCACLNKIFCDPEKPFPWILTFTGIVMLTQTIMCLAIGVTNLANQSGCQLVLWLLIQGPVALVIFLFSIYIHKKINAGSGGSMDRAKTACNIFLYDPGACVFMIVLLFAFVWFILGFVWNSCSSTGDIFRTVKTVTLIAQLLMIFWPVGLFFIWMMVSCCQCCGRTGGQPGHVESGNAKMSPPVVQTMQPSTNPQYNQQSGKSSSGYSFPVSYK